MPGIRRPTLWFWLLSLPLVILDKMCSLLDVNFLICDVRIIITGSERGLQAIVSVKIRLRVLSAGLVVRYGDESLGVSPPLPPGALSTFQSPLFSILWTLPAVIYCLRASIDICSGTRMPHPQKLTHQGPAATLQLP